MKIQRKITNLFLFSALILTSCGGYNEELASNLENAINDHDKATKAFCDCVNNSGNNCEELMNKAKEAEKAVDNLYVDTDMNDELGAEMNTMYINQEGDVSSAFFDCKAQWIENQSK